MQIDGRLFGQVVVVKPMDGRMDAASASDLKGAVVDWVSQGHRLIVLDLERVEFMDSGGLSALFSCLKTVGPKGALVLCSVQKPVESLFDLTRVNRVFKVFKTLEAALEALAPPAATQ